MHAATAFEIMRKEKHDILSRLEKAERNEVRKLVITAVVSTDNALHAKVFGGMKAYLDGMRKEDGSIPSDAAPPEDDEHISMLLSNTLHAADVSNVCFASTL